MHINIDTYGVRLEIDNGMIKFSNGDEVRLIAISKVKSINCLKPISITSAVIVACASQGVPILYYNKNGKVNAWTWSHKYGNIADIRVSQSFYSVSSEKNIWVKKLIKLKIENQISNLSWLINRKSKYKTQIELSIDLISQLLISLGTAQSIANIRGLEGQVSKIYWEQIFAAIELRISHRIKKNANDIFNCALNYMYGILYGKVESSLVMHGLDPYLGLMHMNRHDKPALAFDHIEPFRPWADRMLMQLFIAGFDSEENIVVEEGLLSISKSGRKLLIDSIFGFFEERSYLNGKRIKNLDHVHHLSNELVNVLKKYDRS